MSTSTKPVPSIHIIDGYVPIHDSYQRMFREFLSRKDADVKVYTDHIAYFNAVRPDELPSVLIMGNCQIGMTGLDLAAKFRRESFTGKIFIFTGDPGVQATQFVDAVLYKPGDFRRLIALVNQALQTLA